MGQALPEPKRRLRWLFVLVALLSTPLACSRPQSNPPHARPSTESERQEQSSSIPEKAKPSELANEFAETMKSYLGKDLRCLDETEKEQFNQLTSAFIPQPTTEEEQVAAILLGYDSWYVWQDGNDPGKQRFILFQVFPIMSVPGVRAARVFVLDSTGDVLSQCEFSLGWRIDVVDACWNADADRGFPCIKVAT